MVVDRDAFNRWQSGTKIQDAFPTLSPEERETMVSGVCSDECWDKLSLPPEPEEEIDEDWPEEWPEMSPEVRRELDGY